MFNVDMYSKYFSSVKKAFLPINVKQIKKVKRKHLEIQDFANYDLFDIQKDWAKEFESDERTVMFLCSRKYGKTDVLTIFKIAQMLYNNPWLTFIISTATERRGIQIVETLGHILQFKGLKGKYAQRSIRIDYRHYGYYRDNIKQPSVVLITTDGSTKGNHAHYCVMDDPVEPKHEYSEKYKDRAINFYAESHSIAEKTRIIGQPVAEDDLYATIRNEVRCIEAWYGDIPELDRHINKEDHIRLHGSRDWYKNYEGKFVLDENALFSLEDQHFFDSSLPENKFKLQQTVMFIDPSYQGNKDFTAVVVGRVVNGMLWCKGYMYKHARELIENIEDLILKHQVGYIQIDATNDKFNGLASAIEKLKIAASHVREIKSFVESENKQSKISNNLYYIFGGNRVKIDSSTDKRFINQIKTYVGKDNQYDDAPDVLACMVRQFRLRRLL